MISQKQLLENLRTQIIDELSFCNSLDTPFVCQAVSSAENKEKIIENIMNLVAFQGLTIGGAIVLLEHELNPKYTLD